MNRFQKRPFRKSLYEAAPTYHYSNDELDAIEALGESAPTYHYNNDELDAIEALCECGDEEIMECSDQGMLQEDLDSSFASLVGRLMSESEVELAAKKIWHGAKVKIEYVTDLKLDANYARGKFVKKYNKQYPVVKAILKVKRYGCTGVNYNNTTQAQLLHSTQQYQDKLAARQSAGLGGFGTNVHSTKQGLENVLVTTATGKKCVLFYPFSHARTDADYFISVDGEDWRKTEAAEIAQYMTETDAKNLLNPAGKVEKTAKYQAQVRNNAGQNVMVDADFTVRDIDSGEKLKINPSPKTISYFDPNNRFKGIITLDKESTVVPVVTAPVETSPEIEAENNPLNQDFPEVVD